MRRRRCSGEGIGSGRWHGGVKTVAGHCSNVYFNGIRVCGYLEGYTAPPSPCSAGTMITYICFCYYVFFVVRETAATGAWEGTVSAAYHMRRTGCFSTHRRPKACTMKRRYQTAVWRMHSTIRPERVKLFGKQDNPARVVCIKIRGRLSDSTRRYCKSDTSIKVSRRTPE